MQCSKELTDSVVRTKSPKLANLRSSQSACLFPRALLASRPRRLRILYDNQLVHFASLPVGKQRAFSQLIHQLSGTVKFGRKKRKKKNKDADRKREYNWVFAGGRGQQTRLYDKYIFSHGFRGSGLNIHFARLWLLSNCGVLNWRTKFRLSPI